MSTHLLPGEADGLSKAEAGDMAFLASAGLAPSNAAFRAGDNDTLPGTLAPTPVAQELTASEIETTKLLSRAGFVRGADRSFVPGESDGLNKAEAETMEFLARAGFVPSAKPARAKTKLEDLL